MCLSVLHFGHCLTPSLPQPVQFPGLNGARTRLQTVDFLVTSTFNAMRFDENHFTRQCEKEDKKTEGFQISHFYGSFSSDVMAVKGLNRVIYIYIYAYGEEEQGATIRWHGLLACLFMFHRARGR